MSTDVPTSSALDVHQTVLEELGEAPPQDRRVDWSGSLFENWHTGTVGRYGELLVRAHARSLGSIVEDADDSVFDWRINGRRAEVKTCKTYEADGRPYYRFFAVYPHTLDDLFLVTLDPTRVRMFHMSGMQAERALQARHNLTLVSAIRHGARVVCEFEVPRA